MLITRPVARTAAAYLRDFATPEAAAHQARISLQAIAPYRDRALSSVIACLEYIARAKGDRRARLETTLFAMALEYHQAEDPHCTCPDCIVAHFESSAL